MWKQIVCALVGVIFLGAQAPWQAVVVIPNNIFPAAPFSTWDATRNTASNTYSGGNLIVTCSNCTGESNALDTNNKTSGKWYFEITNTVLSNTCCWIVGIANSSFGSTDNLDFSPNAVGYDNAGNVKLNGALLSTLATYTTGSVICIAVDVANKLIWFRVGASGNWNNNASYDPGTGVGGINFAAISINNLYPAVSFGYTTTGQATLNVGASAFTGVVPSGFSPWG